MAEQKVYIKTNVDGKGFPRNKYLHVRVDVDIQILIRRGVMLKLNDQKQPQWYDLQYNRLPNFCYNCGRLGHVMDDCDSE